GAEGGEGERPLDGCVRVDVPAASAVACLVEGRAIWRGRESEPACGGEEGERAQVLAASVNERPARAAVVGHVEAAPVVAEESVACAGEGDGEELRARRRLQPLPAATVVARAEKDAAN